MGGNLFILLLTIITFFAGYSQKIKVVGRHSNPLVLPCQLYARHITLAPIGNLSPAIGLVANNRISKINICNIYKYYCVSFYVGFVPNNVLIILKKPMLLRIFLYSGKNEAEY